MLRKTIAAAAILTASAVYSPHSTLATTVELNSVAATTVSLTVLSANVQGAGDEGQVASGNLDRVVAAIKKEKPGVVLLQEVCGTDLGRLRQEFPNWTFANAVHIAYRADKVDDSRCPAGSTTSVTRDTMLVVGSAAAISNVSRTPLPMEDRTYNTPGENTRCPQDQETDLRGCRITYTLLCADVRAAGTPAGTLYRACTTHLKSSSEKFEGTELRQDQTAKIASELNPVIARNSMPVVLTGDFNAGPWRTELSAIYRLTNAGTFTGNGRFFEGDQTDQASWPPREQTTCHRDAASGSIDACRLAEFTAKGRLDGPPTNKFDYIFYSMNAASGVSGLEFHTVENPFSGHNIAVSTARLTFQ